MTKGEFLEKLREFLASELDARTVQDHIDYYDSYIREETARGRSEQEVVEELGDPWVIARSMIHMAEQNMQAEEKHSETADRSGRRSGPEADRPISHLRVWWKRLLLILGMIGIFLIVIAVIGGIFSLLMPVILPVLFILLAFRMITGMRR